ncbi:MAG: hypothetical protein Q4P33_06620 [Flaviflexus sp.]|nr:hypothetical protein [Flaviflexus sp.]
MRRRLWIAAGAPLLAALPASPTCAHVPWAARLVGLAHADPACTEGSALGPSLYHLLLAALALGAVLAGADLRPPERTTASWPKLPTVPRLAAAHAGVLAPLRAHVGASRSRGPPGRPRR